MDREIITDLPMEILSVRVPQYIRREVLIIAEREQKTVSDYMRSVLSEGIKRQKT